MNRTNIYSRYFLCLTICSIFYVALFYIINVYVFNLRSTYFDETFYIKAGLAYLKGEDPSMINYEHPPLAKYLIGLSKYVTDNPRIFSWLLGLVGCLITFIITHHLTNDYLKSCLASCLLASDLLFIRVSYHALLDVYSVTFSLIAILFIIKYLKGKRIYLVYSSIFMALSLSSKWNVAYIALLIFIFLFYIAKKRKRIFDLILFISIIITIYSLTYIHTIILKGVKGFIDTQLKALEYHSIAHSPTLLTLINGYSKLFTKISLWPSFGHITLVLKNNTLFTIMGANIINLTIMNGTASYTAMYQGLEVQIEPWIGSLTWFLALPLTYYIILQVKRFEMPVKLTCIAYLGALASLVHGDIDWYYYIVLHYLYILIVTIWKRSYTYILLILSLVYIYIILHLNLLNARITFTLT